MNSLFRSGKNTITVTFIGIVLSASWLYPHLYAISLLGHAALIAYATLHTPARSFLVGAGAGTVMLAIAFHWAPASIAETTNLPRGWPTAVYFILVTWESFLLAAFAGMISLAAKQGIYVLLLAPAWWISVEFLWPRVFTWGIAHTHSDVLPLMQVAELGGTSAVSAVVILAALSIAMFVLGIADSLPDRRGALQVSLVSAAVVAVAFGWGRFRIEQVDALAATALTLRVAAIQVDPTFVESVDQLRARSLPLQDDVDLVLWPESAIGNYHVSLGDFGDAIRVSELSESPCPAEDPTKHFKACLLAGGKLYGDGGRDAGPYQNTAFLISPEKQILGRYVKRTLIPFGEYLPGESLLPALRYWAALDAAITPGTIDEPLNLPSGAKLGTLICYEDMICENARRTVLAGAECLAVIINGSAFRDSDTLTQHLRLAQLRAIENRRAMLRCAATGVTCFIAPSGRIEARLPVGVDGQLVAAVPRMTLTTLYTVSGNAFAWLCIVVTLCWGVQFAPSAFDICTTRTCFFKR